MRFKILILLFLIPIFLFGEKPHLLLLKTYKGQDITGWVMSEKLDGIRAYWDGKRLISRGGNEIFAPAWFTEDYPPFEIDGELWSRRGDFDNISSIVRDRVPSIHWREIKHYIFEVPNAEGGLLERLKKVEPYQNNVIKIIPQIKINSEADLKKFHQKLELLGGEGVVVRDPNAPYINKRTSKALKLKSFKDTECVITGYTKGKGKYEGKIGAIICELPNKISFKIGSGLSDRLRSNPPKVGVIITFKYQNLTRNGKPRFPVFMRVR